jgi:LacI family transcriptional regulator
VEAFKFLGSFDCDGAIVRIMNTAMLREAKKIHFPIVNVSSWLEKPGVPTVRHDYDACGRLAAEHLLGKRIPALRLRGGSRRLVCPAAPRCFCAHHRSTRRNHQHVPPEINHARGRGAAGTAERRRFVEWVRTLKRPVGLALMDDWEAPILQELCREAGYEVPRDLVMISTGYHREAQPLCRVPLTAVQEDQELQARLAVGCLEVLMTDKQPRETLINVPPLGVSERESTATMAIEDREVAHAVEFIRAHGFEPINVSDVCGRVQVARVTLERRFRHIMGQTMHDYLTQLRVRRGKELLLQEPPLSLQAIAVQCGLADRRRLNQVFLSVLGKTPAAWREDPVS